MATYKRQLIDKDGNTIIPDIGIDLDDVVYADEAADPSAYDPWITSDDIQEIDYAEGNTSSITLGAGKWLVVASLNSASTSGSAFSTTYTWLGKSLTVAGSANMATALTFTAVIDVASTYTSAVSKSGSTTTDSNYQWTAIKVAAPASAYGNYEAILSRLTVGEGV